jgi:hypothetical protein
VRAGPRKCAGLTRRVFGEPGGFHGTVDFNPGAATFTLTSQGGSDVFAWVLDTAGQFVWAGRMGSSGTTWVRASRCKVPTGIS